MNEYTAITTKIKAMRKDLINDDDLQQLNHAQSLNDIYQFLDQSSRYRQAFESFDVNPNDRETLELAIKRGTRYDFLKLYRFTGMEQRKFLQVYGMEYEGTIIKRALRHVAIYQNSGLIMDDFARYLEKHRHFNMNELLLATDVTGVTNALRSTDYGSLLNNLSAQFQDKTYDHFAVERAIDSFIELKVWKAANKYLAGPQAKQFRKMFGTEFDLINIMTIYRLKFYYELDNEDISESVFSIGSKLSYDTINQLLMATDTNSFLNIVSQLGYDKINEPLRQAGPVRDVMQDIISTIQKRAVRTQPNSMLTILSYLEDLKNESQHLMQLIERISTNTTTQHRKELA